MRNYLLVCVFIIISNVSGAQQDFKPSNFKHKIYLSLQTDLAGLPDTLQVNATYFPDEFLATAIDKQFKRAKDRLRWTIPADNLISVSIESLKPLNKFDAWLLEPGDSITVSFYSGKLNFEGKGSEKLRLENEIAFVAERVPKPANPTFLVTNSVKDYQEYNAYLHKLWAAVESTIELHKSYISEKALLFIKANYLGNLEYKRSKKMEGLQRLYILNDKDAGVSSALLCDLFDSTFYSESSKWMRSQPVWVVSEQSYLNFIRTLVMRQQNFNKEYRSKNNLRNIIEAGKKEYNGLAREYFLAQVLTQYIIKEIGVTAETEQILSTYYNESHNPAYKKMVREFELKARILGDGQKAPELTLNGSPLRFTGRMTLLNFEDPAGGDKGKRRKALAAMQDMVNHDTNLLILDIPVREVNSLQAKAYNISNTPAIYLVDQEGRIIVGRFKEKELISGTVSKLVSKQLEVINQQKWISDNDGPYVVTEAETEKAYYIINKKIVEKPIDRNLSNTLVSNTDQVNRTFHISLKKQLTIEPGIYEAPDKLIALSDIEGNFDALRKLLQANKVIDEQFEWTFGTGHLVFAGDLFDRGDQVTECLWLIYSLEEKAKAAGGYVHYILGNHEIMNLNGDLHYTREKYKENARSFHKEYSKALYGENSELGRWLRTKNVIEKIGDILFVHGGISEKVNNLSLSIDEINSLSRKYYDKSTLAYQSSNVAVVTLFDNKLAPFWYRQYYQSEEVRVALGDNRLDTTYKTPAGVIDSVLAAFRVKKIVTGHTIYKGDNNYGHFLSVHYNGRVINLDTKHAAGFSEALYFEKNKYYRVNVDGTRWLLSSLTGTELAK